METSSSLTDWLQITFSVIAGLYAITLLQPNNKQRRKSYMLDIYKNFYGDNDITDILYYVDKAENDGSIQHGGILEKKADKTLHYLDFIGQMIQDKDIKKSELSKFRYEIKRIIENEEVSQYIVWLRGLNVPLQYLERLFEL